MLPPSKYIIQKIWNSSFGICNILGIFFGIKGINAPSYDSLYSKKEGSKMNFGLQGVLALCGMNDAESKPVFVLLL